MKNNFSRHCHFVLDFDNPFESYIDEYLNYLCALSSYDSSSKVLKQLIFFSAFRDDNFISFRDYLYNF